MYVVITSLLMACSSDKSGTYVLINAISQIDTSNKVQQLHEYDSPYTICYQNPDGTYSFYVFSSPIQYKTSNGYEIIDNTVVESSDKNYTFENKANNIKTYFPVSLSDSFKIAHNDDFLEFKVQDDVTGFSEAKKLMYTNMYGDIVSAVIYERSDMDMVFYPTKAGIKSEIVLKEKTEVNQYIFSVTGNSNNYQNNQNGYILFKDGKRNVGLIYAPLIKGTKEKYDEDGNNFSLHSTFDVVHENNNYTVSVKIDDNLINNESTYPVKFDPSIELYLSKQPDSGVYSKQEKTNSYLKSISIIGNSDSLGMGIQYIRFRFNYFLSCDPNSVISSFYHIRSLSNFSSCEKIYIYKLNKDWSSTGLNWNNKIDYGEKITDQIIDKSKNIKFEITEFTKKCFSDKTWMTESNGVLLKGSDNNTYRVFTSSDNSLYSPYVEINLKSLPSSFTCREDINPSN